MDNIAISVEHVKKIYKLYDRNRDRLKDALGFSKKPLGKEHYALNDVSFQVGQGETVGIIGTNGSGKSHNFKDHHWSFESNRWGSQSKWAYFCVVRTWRRI